MIRGQGVPETVSSSIRRRLGEETTTKLAVSYREAAHALGVCEKTIFNLVHARKLSAFRIGRAVRIPVFSIQQYIESQTTELNSDLPRLE